MSREHIAVFCPEHIPRRNAVVYELVGETFEPGQGSGDAFHHQPPRGWRMAVRYRRRPPVKYGLQAAEPNVGSDYLAEHRTLRGKSYYFTNHSASPRRTEGAAIEGAIQAIEQQRARLAKDTARLQEMLAADRRVWEGLKTQCELRSHLERIAFGIPLVRRLRESGDLVALLLIGSLRNRDFVPGLSDIDLWVLGRRLKPGLRIEYAKKHGQEIEVNLVCRNLRFFLRALRQGTPVDLMAVRYGEVLYCGRSFRALRRRAHRCGVTPATREMWLKSSARWLSMAIQQYLSPDCPHCFFSALYHAGRDLLRAHLVAHGGDQVEGWEVEAAAGERWPDLAKAFGRIRWARAHWESYAFPLLVDRRGIDGDLGALLLSLETISRAVYLDDGLRLPGFQEFFGGFARQRRAKRFFLVDIQPDDGVIRLGYEKETGQSAFARRKIPRVG